MEVCDLEECDFLETKFYEYPTNELFISDSKDQNICMSNDNKQKGIIVHFHCKDGTPKYIYKPLNILSQTDCDMWCDSILKQYENNDNYMFLSYIYWKLEICSCVLVSRNTKWFNDNVSEISKIWDIILHERVHGSQHRAPNRKIKPDAKDITSYMKPVSTGGCLLTFKKPEIIINKLDIPTSGCLLTLNTGLH